MYAYVYVGIINFLKSQKKSLKLIDRNKKIYNFPENFSELTNFVGRIKPWFRSKHEVKFEQQNVVHQKASIGVQPQKG